MKKLTFLLAILLPVLGHTQAPAYYFNSNTPIMADTFETASSLSRKRNFSKHEDQKAVDRIELVSAWDSAAVIRVYLKNGKNLGNFLLRYETEIRGFKQTDWCGIIIMDPEIQDGLIFYTSEIHYCDALRDEVEDMWEWTREK